MNKWTDKIICQLVLDKVLNTGFVRPLGDIAFKICIRFHGGISTQLTDLLL